MVGKRLLTAVVVATLLLSFSGDGFAGELPSVFIEDRFFVSSPPPVFADGRVLVPLRSFFEAVGGTVDFRAEDGRITAVVNDRILILWTGQSRAFVNGKEMKLDTPPKVVGGTTLVPLRFVAESLGARVGWNQEELTARVELPDDVQLRAEALPVFPYSVEEVELLARLIYAEAGMEPYVGMVAVGAVVMNRIAHADFPDSLEGVIFQPGQFPSIKSANFKKSPPQAAIRAAREAMMGADPTDGALFFHNPELSVSGFFWDRPTAVVIGNHRFTR